MPRPLPEEKRREWKKRIRLQHKSGQCISKWCREKQINYDSFLYWKKRFSPSPINRSTFLELTDPCKDAGIFIEYKEMKIVLVKNFDPTILTQCLKTLKSLF